MEDGTEKLLKNPGDVVIQKGTMHAWKNPSQEWTRWVTVLIAGEPAVVDGKQLSPAVDERLKLYSPDTSVYLTHS